jgi:hypothetical protein
VKRIVGIEVLLWIAQANSPFHSVEPAQRSGKTYRGQHAVINASNVNLDRSRSERQPSGSDFEAGS